MGLFQPFKNICCQKHQLGYLAISAAEPPNEHHHPEVEPHGERNRLHKLGTDPLATLPSGFVVSHFD